MKKVLTGIFHSRSNAMLAIEDLVRHGCPRDDISLLMSDTTHSREFAVDESTKAPEGLAAGAAIGGALGAIALGLAATGLVAAPIVGLYATGQWLAMLAGFGAGALGGGIIGGLVGLGIPEHEAEIYLGEIAKGGILVGVFVPDEAKARETHKLLEASGGVHIKEAAAKESAPAEEETVQAK